MNYERLIVHTKLSIDVTLQNSENIQQTLVLIKHTSTQFIF